MRDQDELRSMQMLAMVIMLTLAAILVVVICIASHSTTVVPDDGIAECLPIDQGEKAVLWLEPEHGGLMLHCEKHEVLAYGMAQVPVSME